MGMRTRSRFPLGRLVVTPGARDVLQEGEYGELLERHRAGDWGDVSTIAHLANDESVRAGLLIHSAYTVWVGARVWVVTEADRSKTTIRLPWED